MKQIIRDIPKNGRETIRVELVEFEGTQLVAARVWYVDGDELRPTRKGLSLAIKHLPALVQALQQAERNAREAGILS